MSPKPDTGGNLTVGAECVSCGGTVLPSSPQQWNAYGKSTVPVGTPGSLCPEDDKCCQGGPCSNVVSKPVLPHPGSGNAMGNGGIGAGAGAGAGAWAGSGLGGAAGGGLAGGSVVVPMKF